MSAEFDFTEERGIDKGATWIKTIIWKNSGVPINLEEYSAVFTIKPSPSSDEVILEIDSDSTADSYIEIDGTAGLIELIIDSTSTQELSFDLAFYDLKLTDGDDIVTKLLRGRVSLNE